MAVQIKKTVKGVAAVPRSVRLRDAVKNGTITYAADIAAAAGEIVAISDHAHSNLATLERLMRVDNDASLWVRVGGTEVKVRAGEADHALHADNADNLSADAEILSHYLSKDHDDTANGKIAFKGGATFGDFVSGLNHLGRGAEIDSQGNAEVESLRVRSAMEVMELIVNKQSTLEGDQILSPGDTIESVRSVGLNVNECIITLREKYEGYDTSLMPGDIVRGIYFDRTMGRYETSWVKVLSRVSIIVDGVEEVLPRMLKVSVYNGTKVPGGVNYFPRALMNIARWGSETDTTRQSCFYLSSTEGRIVRLKGVDSPILRDDNYASVFGVLPTGFLSGRNLPWKEGLDYAYLRGLVVQDIIRTDYQGNPLPLDGMRPNLLDRTSEPWENVVAKSKVGHDDFPITIYKDGVKSMTINVNGTAQYDEDGNSCSYVAYPIRAGLLKNWTAYTVSLGFYGDNEGDVIDIYIGDLGPEITGCITNVVRSHLPNRSEKDNEMTDGNFVRRQYTLHTRTNWLELGKQKWLIIRFDTNSPTVTDYEDNSWLVDLGITELKLEEGSTATPWCASEYDRLGKQGERGEQGEPGEPGARGDRGASLRGPQRWEGLPDDYVFYCGAEGEKFLDVVIYNGYYYYCKQTHVKSQGTPGNDAFWQLGDITGMVATDILLAKYAKVKNLGVETVETENDTTGGARIVIKGGKIDVFGTANPEQPNISFGVDETGMAVLNFYDNEGKFLYNLGPNGLKYSSVREQSWDVFWLYPIQVSEPPQRADAAWKNQTGVRCVKYRSGVNAGVLLDAEHDGRCFQSSNEYLNPLPDRDIGVLDGWYVQCNISTHKVQEFEFATSVSELGQAPTITKYAKVSRYENGFLKQTYNVNFQ